MAGQLGGQPACGVELESQASVTLPGSQIGNAKFGTMGAKGNREKVSKYLMALLYYIHVSV